MTAWPVFPAEPVIRINDKRGRQVSAKACRPELLAAFFERYETAPHGFRFHGFLQVATYVIATALSSGEVAGQILGVHDVLGEQIEVHILIEAFQRVHL